MNSFHSNRRNGAQTTHSWRIRDNLDILVPATIVVGYLAISASVNALYPPPRDATARPVILLPDELGMNIRNTGMKQAFMGVVRKVS
jgi:hypothetical protein